MKNQLTDRLTALKSERTKGKEMLIELKTKYSNLEKSLLRIEGAIQVLTEELEKAEMEPSASFSNVVNFDAVENN